MLFNAVLSAGILWGSNLHWMTYSARLFPINQVYARKDLFSINEIRPIDAWQIQNLLQI